jgi:hypothetical protein
LESIICEIRADIKGTQSNKALYEEASFSDRVVALDFLEFDVIERIEGLLLTDGWHGSLPSLKQYAKGVQMQLETVDESLFQRIRVSIASQASRGLAMERLLLKYAGSNSGERSTETAGYDTLDALTNGFLLMGAAPEETRTREPEMVYYQPTPARVVLELVEKADFQPNDVFYDIGSGLGQFVMLVHLLSRVRAKGVEFEPAFCDYARRCARELNLSRVGFTNADAREVDYSDGTMFFMYTPFVGKMMERVLEKLKDESGKRGFRLYTYGPCTSQVAQQGWLERVDQNGSEVYRLATFRSAGFRAEHMAMDRHLQSSQDDQKVTER